MKKTHVLIVGGAGSIGSALALRLEHMRVTVIDLKPPKQQVGEFIQCDLQDVLSVKNAREKLPNEKYLVIYLASIVKNGSSATQMREILDANVIALGNFLSVFSEWMVHFVLASSISVYGWSGSDPVVEGHPLDPQTIYGVSKASAEMLLRAYSSERGFPTTVLRIAQLYGATSAADALPQRLLTQVSHGPLVLQGGGEAIRDYLFLGDLISLMKKVVENPEAGVFNVGSDMPISIREVFEAFSRASGRKLHVDSSEGSQVLSQVMSSKRVKQVYGFEAQMTLEQWYRESLGKKHD